MRKILEAFEGRLEDDCLMAVRSHAQALVARLKRLGTEPEEEKVLEHVVDFVRGINKIQAKFEALGTQEGVDIRDWFEELSLERDLSIASIDDLDEVEATW